MPRKLPWLDTTAPDSSSSRRKRGRLASSSTPKAELPTRRLHLDRDNARTPSTSPPPQAPTTTPMRVTDTAWVMVEDEFYATAQLFTQHLHHAEYKRLKGMASRKTVEALGAIERPTRAHRGKSNPSFEKMVGKAQADKRSTAKTAIHTIANAKSKSEEIDTATSTEGEEEFAIADRNLACLMRGTGTHDDEKDTQALAALVKHAKSNTRAAAGFKKQHSRPSSRDNSGAYEMKARTVIQTDLSPPSPAETDADDEDDDDEEDLDAPVRSQRMPIPRTLAPISLNQKYSSLPTPLRDKHANDSRKREIPDQKSIVSRDASITSASLQDSKKKSFDSHAHKYSGPRRQVVSRFNDMQV